MPSEAMEAKDVKLYALKFLGFSVKTASLYVQKYPLPSGLLILFFLLYLLFPFVFKLLLYSIPIVACVVTGLRIYTSSSRSICKAEGFKGDGKGEPGTRSSKPESDPRERPIRRLKKPIINPQMSKRRNFKIRWEDIDGQGPAEVRQAELYVPDDNNIITGKNSERITENSMLGQALDQESDHRESSSDEENFDEHAPIKGDSDPPEPFISLKDENPKPVISLKDKTPEPITFVKDETDNDLGNIVPRKSWAEAAEEVAKQDQVRDDGSEDDQKNVMDLGFSQQERYRRLESLIAKRRARKFMNALRSQPNLFNLERNVANYNHVPRVHLIKRTPFAANAGGFEEDIDSPFPGSAPSILLPSRNPFDIPYDPQEEKPVLTADGFQQEKLASSQQRDLLRRHGSFTHGPSSSSNIYQDQDIADGGLHSRRDGQIPREGVFSRFRRLAVKGNHSRLVGHILNQRQNFSDSDEPEDDSPREMPKHCEITEDQNTENSDGGVEKTTEFVYGSKDAPPNVYPQTEVLTEAKGEAAGSDSSHTSQGKEVPIQKESGKDSSDIEKVEVLPGESAILTEKPPNPIFSNSNSGESIVEYLSRGMGHNTSYSIASDMQVEVSEPSSPRNNPEDIITPDDDVVLEEDESKQTDGHQQEDAMHPGISSLNIDLVDSSVPEVSVRDLDEEDSASKSSTSSSSTNPNTDEGHSKDQVASHDSISQDKASGIRRPWSPDSSDSEIPEAIQFVDHSTPPIVQSSVHEEMPSSIGSSSVEISENTNNERPIEQDPADEIRNHDEQETIPHAGKLEEDDINPFGSPLEEASITYTAVDSTSKKAENGESNPETGTAEAHKGVSQAVAGEEPNPSNDIHSN